jgi:predicted nucleic acid-binding protein
MPENNPHFLDTSIWRYAVLKKGKPEKIESAQSLLKMQPAIVSTQVINEVSSELLKDKKLGEEAVKDFIEAVFNNHRVVELDKDGYLMAADFRRDYSLDLRDSLIIAAAFFGGARMIYSDALKPGVIYREVLHTINPFPKPGRPRK